ncbi:cellulose binding domain-containing protein [Streptomyces sp. SMS_SU21]|uniref:cellulose binding domain-containing protein n=1 Tax=Streptomyces sp. SMS_SU21 TaxID=2069440 RepID=UPI0015E80BF5|nr:cellulose binding domain-containing protein [Streptomyces sp. SMS_SU21]
MPADRPDGSAALRAALTNPDAPDAACTAAHSTSEQWNGGLRTRATPTRPATAASTTSEQWNGGCDGRVTITAGGAPVSRWSVTPALGSSQQVVSAWNRSPSHSGSVMTVRSAWNGSPAARLDRLRLHRRRLLRVPAADRRLHRLPALPDSRPSSRPAPAHGCGQGSGAP